MLFLFEFLLVFFVPYLRAVPFEHRFGQNSNFLRDNKQLYFPNNIKTSIKVMYDKSVFFNIFVLLYSVPSLYSPI